MNNTAKLWAALCPLVLLGMIWGAALLFEVAPVAAWWVWPAFATLWIAGSVAIGVCMYRALTLWEDTHD